MIQFKVVGGEEILRSVSFQDVVESIEKYLKLRAKGKVLIPPRITFTPPKGWWGIMPCYVKGGRYAIVKIVSSFPENYKLNLPCIQGLILVLDNEDGRVKYAIDAITTTALRTASASLIAAKYSVWWKPRKILLIGCGVQGSYHAKAFLEYFQDSELYLYDIEPSKALKLSRELGTARVKVALKLQDVRKNAPYDIVLACTTSKTPVVYDWMLGSRAFICSIGAHKPEEREVSDKVVEKAELIIVDTLEGCKSETGDIIQPLKAGMLEGKKIIELHQLLNYHVKEKIIFYKSVGTALFDYAATIKILEKLGLE